VPKPAAVLYAPPEAPLPPNDAVPGANPEEEPNLPAATAAGGATAPNAFVVSDAAVAAAREDAAVGGSVFKMPSIAGSFSRFKSPVLTSALMYSRATAGPAVCAPDSTREMTSAGRTSPSARKNTAWASASCRRTSASSARRRSRRSEEPDKMDHDCDERAGPPRRVLLLGAQATDAPRVPCRTRRAQRNDIDRAVVLAQCFRPGVRVTPGWRDVALCGQGQLRKDATSSRPSLNQLARGSRMRNGTSVMCNVASALTFSTQSTEEGLIFSLGHFAIATLQRTR
jgi:hypothetical protein